MVSMGPIEEPFGYSKQQRPAGTLSTVSASPAIIYSCWRPSLVTMAKLSIHSGYLPGKRPPPGAGTRLLHRLRQLAFRTPPDRAKQQTHTSTPSLSLPPLPPFPSHDLYTSPVRLTAYAQHRRSVPSARVTLRHEIVPSHSLNVPDPPPRFLTIVRSVVRSPHRAPFPFNLLASRAIVSSAHNQRSRVLSSSWTERGNRVASFFFFVS